VRPLISKRTHKRSKETYFLFPRLKKEVPPLPFRREKGDPPPHPLPHPRTRFSPPPLLYTTMTLHVAHQNCTLKTHICCSVIDRIFCCTSKLPTQNANVMEAENKLSFYRAMFIAELCVQHLSLHSVAFGCFLSLQSYPFSWA
jgi:hypothetical protein